MIALVVPALMMTIPLSIYSGEEYGDMVVVKPTINSIDTAYPEVALYGKILAVAYAHDQRTQIKIINSTGKIVNNQMLVTDGSRHDFDLSSLPEGKYTLSIESATATFQGEFTLE